MESNEQGGTSLFTNTIITHDQHFTRIQDRVNSVVLLGLNDLQKRVRLLKDK